MTKRTFGILAVCAAAVMTLFGVVMVLGKAGEELGHPSA